MKKTKPARNAMPEKNNSNEPVFDKDFPEQHEDSYWHSLAGGGEKREKKKKPKMRVSGKSVLKLKRIIERKLQEG